MPALKVYACDRCGKTFKTDRDCKIHGTLAHAKITVHKTTPIDPSKTPAPAPTTPTSQIQEIQQTSQPVPIPDTPNPTPIPQSSMTVPKVPANNPIPVDVNLPGSTTNSSIQLGDESSVAPKSTPDLSSLIRNAVEVAIQSSIKPELDKVREQVDAINKQVNLIQESDSGEPLDVGGNGSTGGVKLDVNVFDSPDGVFVQRNIKLTPNVLNYWRYTLSRAKQQGNTQPPTLDEFINEIVDEHFSDCMGIENVFVNRGIHRRNTFMD